MLNIEWIYLFLKPNLLYYSLKHLVIYKNRYIILKVKKEKYTQKTNKPAWRNLNSESESIRLYEIGEYCTNWHKHQIIKNIFKKYYRKSSNNLLSTQ